MKLSPGSRCYCCEKTASTKDHIPPKCFFPETKHLPKNSPDYRKDLITVPSCSEHNNSRSKDDEYTAVVIAMNSESDLGLALLKSKWIKTMCRKDAVLGKRIFSTAKKTRVWSRKENLLIPHETLSISYEITRINNVIKSIARGIYYWELQNNWLDDIDIIIPQVLDEKLKPRQDINSWQDINQNFIDLQAHEKFKLMKKGSALPNLQCKTVRN